MSTVRVAPPDLASRRTTVSLPRVSPMARGLPQVRTVDGPTRPLPSAMKPLAPPPPLPSSSRIPVRRPASAPRNDDDDNEMKDLLSFANKERMLDEPAPGNAVDGLIPKRSDHRHHHRHQKHHRSQQQEEDDLPSDLDNSSAGGLSLGEEEMSDSFMSGEEEDGSDLSFDSAFDSDLDSQRAARAALPNGLGYRPPTREEREKEKRRRMLERVKLISWLQRKQRLGQIQFEFDVNAPTTELRYIKQKLQFDQSGEAMVKLYRRLLMMLVAGMTALSVWLKWRNVQLQDYDRHFSMQISQYDEILYDIYDKYGGEEQMDPIATLALTVGSDAMQYSFQRSIANRFVDGLGEQFGGRSAAAAGAAAQDPQPISSAISRFFQPSGPAPQAQAQQQPRQPIPQQRPPPPSQPTPQSLAAARGGSSNPPLAPPRPQLPPPTLPPQPPAPPALPVNGPPVPPGGPGVPVFASPAPAPPRPRIPLIPPPAAPKSTAVASRPPFQAPTPDKPAPPPAPPLVTTGGADTTRVVTVEAKAALPDIERKIKADAKAAGATTPRREDLSDSKDPNASIPVRSISMGSPPGTPISIPLSPRRGGGVNRPLFTRPE